MSVNRVLLLGRLTADPELKNTKTGQSVCSFTIATSESWNDKATGNKKESTEFSRIKVWGKVAELCGQYLKKGQQAFIEGKLQTSSYEKDGVKHYTTEIIANNVQFLNAPKKEINEKENPFQDTIDSFTTDSIPF